MYSRRSKKYEVRRSRIFWLHTFCFWTFSTFYRLPPTPACYQVITEKVQLLPNPGKHRAIGGCVSIKKLQHINIESLAKFITASVSYLKEKYPAWLPIFFS